MLIEAIIRTYGIMCDGGHARICHDIVMSDDQISGKMEGGAWATVQGYPILHAYASAGNCRPDLPNCKTRGD
jgi:hypothetical protein